MKTKRERWVAKEAMVLSFKWDDVATIIPILDCVC